MSSLGSYVVYYVHQMHHSLVYDDINLLTYFWTDAIYVAWTGCCFIQQIGIKKVFPILDIFFFISKYYTANVYTVITALRGLCRFSLLWRNPVIFTDCGEIL